MVKVEDLDKQQKEYYNSLKTDKEKEEFLKDVTITKDGGKKDDTTPPESNSKDNPNPAPDGADSNGGIDSLISEEDQLTEEELKKKEERAKYHEEQQKKKQEQQPEKDSNSGFFGVVATLGVVGAIIFVALKWLGFIGDSDTATVESQPLTADSTTESNSETAQPTTSQNSSLDGLVQ